MSGSVSVFNLHFYRPNFQFTFYSSRFQFTILPSQISFTILPSQISIYNFSITNFNLHFYHPRLHTGSTFTTRIFFSKSLYKFGAHFYGHID